MHIFGRYYLFWQVSMLIAFAGNTQKAFIDTGMLYTWPMIDNCTLSTDGNYVAYTVLNQPMGGQSLVMQSTKTAWKQERINVGQFIFFSTDNQSCYWQKGDSIFAQLLGGDTCYLLGSFTRWSYPRGKRGAWLGGMLKNGSFVLCNITNRNTIRFDSVTDYFFEPSGKVLLLYRSHTLQYLSLRDQSIYTIWQGAAEQRPFDYLFNVAGDKLAFKVQDRVWYYEVGMKKARHLFCGQDTVLHNTKIAYLSFFSGNSNWLFVGIEQPLPPKFTHSSNNRVAVWSYRDSVLSPAQLSVDPVYYSVAVGLHNNVVRAISGPQEELLNTQVIADQVIIVHNPLLRGKVDVYGWWPYTEKASYYLINLNSGKRTLLRKPSNKNATGFHFSPDGRWVVYWDEDKADYICYDLLNDVSYNLGSKLPVTLMNESIERENAGPVGFIGWYANDRALLVYDNYDLWRLDPAGRRTPVNLTKGYGLKRGIKLRLVYQRPPDQAIYRDNEILLLTGLDIHNMYNGFYRLSLDRPGEPELLTMGPYTYYQVRSQQGHFYSFNNGMEPLQGGNSDQSCWVVMRQSATEYPNYYFTEDFKIFKPLTNLQPQKNYNWLTTELVKWRMFNGKMSQGVLYKPEDFDPGKKYPIIFNYYEKLSHRLYQFPQPGLTMDNINIPWFLSRGYLVFTPDIHYSIASSRGGMTIGEAAYNAVVSAAQHLIKLPYVDGKRMAMQGHSFGGMETAYLVTHSHLFAAAAEMAGTTDHFSSYLSLLTTREGEAMESIAKQDHPQARMGATPWERPDLYRRNSAVLHADKTTTPVLITHNQRDASINFRQGVALYLALRRLGKPCWLLQYERSGHSLSVQDGLDYTLRLTQFFDHYLKGNPAPDWMK
jgi:dipeptidyl aminopeptidase/acylaminoacyl peptidase